MLLLLLLTIDLYTLEGIHNILFYYQMLMKEVHNYGGRFLTLNERVGTYTLTPTGEALEKIRNLIRKKKTSTIPEKRNHFRQSVAKLSSSMVEMRLANPISHKQNRPNTVAPEETLEECNYPASFKDTIAKPITVEDVHLFMSSIRNN